MPKRHAARTIATFLSLAALTLAFLFCIIPGADSRTIVVGGAVTMSAHATMVDTFTISGLDPAQLTNNSKLTYNAPVFSSAAVSGFSQTISGFHVTVSPTPSSASDLLTDKFGNPYYHYEWSLDDYPQSTFVVTVTTVFDSITTGNPVPEAFDDPYPTTASGMPQFLQSTAMAQSDNAQIMGLSQSLVSGTTTEAAAVEKITDYVIEHVAEGSNPARDAVSTLSTGTGTCVNRANLALALLRAAGIPARFVSGVVSGEPYQVDIEAPEGSGTFNTNWGQENHAWVEVYYPQKGVWVGYDPDLNIGFIDQRHVRSGISVDSDVTGKVTGGAGTLFEVISVNPGVSYHQSTDLGFTGLSDSGQYRFLSLKEPPADHYVLCRDMVNAPTPTPTPTPMPTPTPTPTLTPTPVPSATPIVDPTITPRPNATASPPATPSRLHAAPADVTALNATNATGDDGIAMYNISGRIIDASLKAALENATLTLDGQPANIGADGAFSISVTNGTHTLTADAPGYGTATMSLTVAGTDIMYDVQLSAVTSGTPEGKSGWPIPGFELIAALAGLLIIALYRYGRA